MRNMYEVESHKKQIQNDPAYSPNTPNNESREMTASREKLLRCKKYRRGTRQPRSGWCMKSPSTSLLSHKDQPLLGRRYSAAPDQRFWFQNFFYPALWVQAQSENRWAQMRRVSLLQSIRSIFLVLFQSLTGLPNTCLCLTPFGKLKTSNTMTISEEQRGTRVHLGVDKWEKQSAILNTFNVLPTTVANREHENKIGEGKRKFIFFVALATGLHGIVPDIARFLFKLGVWQINSRRCNRNKWISEFQTIPSCPRAADKINEIRKNRDLCRCEADTIEEVSALKLVLSY